MKAVVYHRYGSPDVLQLQEIGRPEPGDDEVLVRIRAASVNPFEWHFVRGKPLVMRLMTGLFRPKDPRLGVDMAGRIESVGRNVTAVKAGDDVFGRARGAFAEFATAPAEFVAPKPANLTYEEAASVWMAALTALQGLRDHGKLQPGQQVLINGASGGVGTFAVQIATALGAVVTGVCSTRNVDMVRAIGARRVIDYTAEDFARDSQRYDLMYDIIGNRTLSECRRVLTDDGTYVVAGGDGDAHGPIARALKTLVASWFTTQRMVTYVANGNREDLLILKELLEGGKIRPVIDRQYALEETAEALRHVETRRARGKVVISVQL